MARLRRVERLCSFPHIATHLFMSDFNLADKGKWLAVAGGSAVIASFAARNLIRAAWRAFSNEDPPLNPASEDTEWREAVTWTVVVGTAAALAQLVARRGAAATWKSVTGSRPPGLEKQ